MHLSKGTRSIIIWLAAVYILIACIVMVGGITRLTRSGLSIVEWKPFTGVVPPLTEEAWNQEFEKYKKYPEYQKLNKGMTLSEFKFIFFWEFTHRLLGRLVGFVFLIPFLFFYYKKRLQGELLRKIGFAFILGGLQGFMGWYMVSSGLSSMPRVSHYRLAAHLLLAIFIMMYILWIGLGVYFAEKRPDWRESKTANNLARFSWAITALVIFQILYGAFTAGLRAGYIFNTFPLMGTQWVPDGMAQQMPGWINLFENIITVQFIHRYLGWVVLFSVILFFFYSRRFSLGSLQRKGIQALFVAVSIQFLLGVFTILFLVPVSLGVIHQVGAVLLLSLAVYVNYIIKMEST